MQVINNMEPAKRLTMSYIVRLAGCAECLDARLALCANEHGYRTNHLMARRALVASERALQGIKVTQNAVWSRGGDFDATVEYEGMPPLTVTGHLEFTLELINKAAELLGEYLGNPTALDDERPMIEGLLRWVRYCQWDIGHLKDSPKPVVRRAS
jgi:hypothetical protein